MRLREAATAIESEVVPESISCWLEPDLSKPGPAEWRIVGTGLPVWRVLGQFAADLGLDSPHDYRSLLLEKARPALIKEIAQYYDVPPDAIRAALEYSRLYADEVIARLILDRSAFEG